MHRIKLFFLLINCLLLISAVSVRAATYTVANVSDAGAGSLRQAIIDAENNPGADTINVAVTGTVNLTSSLPTVTQSLTINGGGQEGFIVSGQNAVRVFSVSASGDLRLNNLTVRNGRTTGSGGRGGGIRNSGALTINDSTITANSTDQDGGGIANFGTLSINNSTVSGNSAFSGGGIYNVNTLSINNSTLSGNAATTANGGGILNGGEATINNSTISGNTCYLGCGIYNETGTLTLGNSTVVRNVNNVGAGLGGGIYNNNGITSAGNSIVAQNTAGNSEDVIGDFVSRGYNFIGTGAGSTGFGATGDQVGSNFNRLVPGLTPLQNNGGPTQTHAPFSGSPVIDKGKNLAVDANNSPITTDQRGLARTIDYDNAAYPNANSGDGTDIGAVEVAALPDLTITKTHAGNFTQGQTGAQYTITVTNSGGAATDSLLFVNDDVPNGLTPVAASGTGWSCVINTQRVQCRSPISSLAAGASFPPITLTVNVASNATSVTNTVSVEGGGDANVSNNTASDPTTILAPTAASVTVSGRVTVNNRGVANARVTVTGADGQTRTALTNPFGYYRFTDVAAGATYVFQARHKRFDFAPQVLSVSEEMNNLNFTAAR